MKTLQGEAMWPHELNSAPQDLCETGHSERADRVTISETLRMLEHRFFKVEMKRW